VTRDIMTGRMFAQPPIHASAQALTRVLLFRNIENAARSTNAIRTHADLHARIATDTTLRHSRVNRRNNRPNARATRTFEPVYQLRSRARFSSHHAILFEFGSACIESVVMREWPLDVLAEMTADMLDAHDRSSRLQVVTDAALKLTPANHASVRLRDLSDGLRVGARSGVGADRPAPSVRMGQGVLGWVAQTGEAANVRDIDEDPRFSPIEKRGFEVSSLVSIPIRARGETLGVLSLSAPERDAFGADHQSLAQLLAHAAAQALLTSELEELSITDSQTLAYNRRYLLPRLHQEMERATRHGEQLSVLMLDLDHFKLVNDRHGHPVGDAVLRAFADAVREEVRSIDVLVRRGGEEFVLLMPNTGDEAAHLVAERLRVRLASEPLRARPGLHIRQTVSVGVATWDGHESAESLDERADLAMYEAKQDGRNRVVHARPSLPVPVTIAKH
jgi:two-component system, cell cycle response regulator